MRHLKFFFHIFQQFFCTFFSILTSLQFITCSIFSNFVLQLPPHIFIFVISYNFNSSCLLLFLLFCLFSVFFFSISLYAISISLYANMSLPLPCTLLSFPYFIMSFFIFSFISCLHILISYHHI